MMHFSLLIAVFYLSKLNTMQGIPGTDRKMDEAVLQETDVTTNWIEKFDVDSQDYLGMLQGENYLKPLWQLANLMKK